MRFFNTEGPIRPDKHYFVPNRLDWEEVFDLIEKEKYFVLHAPRQTGKTTAIQELVRRLNSIGKYSAIYLNIEVAQAARNQVEKALLSIFSALQSAIQTWLGDEKAILAHLNDYLTLKIPVTMNSLQQVLAFWAQHSQKPIALFIDEIDALIGDSLLSVLRQLRAGYTNRPSYGPQSVCLIGLRDVRDYRVWSQEAGEYVSTSSPFNIKAKSLFLPNFSLEEVVCLLSQHTEETGQLFEQESVDEIYRLTKGQPWLVNALAYEAAFVVQDRTQSITRGVVEQVKEVLIKRRDTHIDSLLDKLHEKRVLPIIDAILQGKTDPAHFNQDDVEYVRDLGLIDSQKMEIANPIYQEIIPRELTAITSQTIAEEYLKLPGYIRSDGALDMQVLLNAFADFYREHGDIWLEKFHYKEAGPHLFLMAFLQRIINGGGCITREYALGRGRVDLAIQWGKQRIVLELKMYRDRKTLLLGLEQTANYMNSFNATEGHLLIFCRDPKKPWKKRFQRSRHRCQGYEIEAWQM